MLTGMSGTRWRWSAAVAIGLAFGCASQRDTGRVLTATGAAAVIIGAATASGGCAPRQRVDGPAGDVEPAVCISAGRDKALGTAIAATGVGVAAVGYALENSASGPDRVPRRRAKSPPPPAPKLKRPSQVVASPAGAPVLAEPIEAPASAEPEPAETEAEPTWGEGGDDESAEGATDEAAETDPRAPEDDTETEREPRPGD
jgi:hypothetical protein